MRWLPMRYLCDMMLKFAKLQPHTYRPHSLTMLRVAALFLLTSSSTVAQNCTLCSDGSSPIGGAFGGTDCAVIAKDLASLPADASDCFRVQAQAFRFCNCSSYPEDKFCPLCKEVKDLPDAKKLIPAGLLKSLETKEAAVLTCADLLFVDSTVEGHCDAAQQAAHYCGCPEATAGDCELCSAAPATANASATVSFGSSELGGGNRRLPPLFQISCRDYKQAASFFTKGTEQCDHYRTGHLPLDVAAYCGCAGTTKAKPPCAICKDVNASFAPTKTLRLEGSDTIVTCAEAADVGEYVEKDSNYCTGTLQSERVQIECCGQETNAPSESVRGNEKEDVPTTATSSAVLTTAVSSVVLAVMLLIN